MRSAFFRAVYAYLVFLPFCWAWGVENSLLFGLLGTLYLVPFHWAFDKIEK